MEVRFSLWIFQIEQVWAGLSLSAVPSAGSARVMGSGQSINGLTIMVGD